MPGIHSSFSRHMFTVDGNVLTSGGAKHLAKGQFTIVKSGQPISSAGATVISDFAGLSKKEPIELRLGKAKVGSTRSARNSKPYASEIFTLEEVVSVNGNYPKISKQTFDELIVGYDGVNDDTAIDIPEGEDSVIDIDLSGEAIGFLANQPCYSFKTHFSREVGQTNQEMVIDLVNVLRKQTLIQGVPITDAIDITVVDSENAPLAGDEYVFNNLTIDDEGNSVDLGRVQAQYPEYKVVRSAREGGVSTYTIVVPAATVLDDYVETQAAYIKDCEDCAAGYDELTGGIVYAVTLEDDGVDQAALVEALPGAVAGTAVRKGDEAGKGLYSVVLDDALTQDEIDTYAALGDIQGTSTIKYIGAVQDVCYDDTETTTAWVAGESCFASTETYQLQLKDACDATRLAEVQAAYPDLTITEEATDPAPAGCQRAYNAEVVTDLVCEECDDIFLDKFTSEAPAPFDFVEWELVPGAPFSETALMGIRLKGKPFTFIPTDVSRDQVPFYETSARISVAAGYVEEPNASFNQPEGDLFNVKRLSRAQDRDNLGAKLLGWEDASRYYFDGEERHPNNQFARIALGEESVLKYDAQYVSYEIEVKDTRRSQGVGRSSDMGTSYIVWAEFGRHSELEDYVNSLAAAAGVEQVAQVSPVLEAPAGT